MFRKSIIVIFSILFILTATSFIGLTRDLEEAYDVDMPEEFGEAPEFQELVDAGELPPVEERLPKNPLVVEPYNNIGEYGGTLLTATTNLNAWGEDLMVMDIMNSFVRPSADAGEIYLNFAKDIEISDDMSDYTIYLREEVKWSDGEPFTTEDIEFWYEDILLNEEITPVIGINFKDADGDVMNLNVIDDYTFKVEFGTTQPFFIETLVHGTGWNWLMPKHYLKQYHPNYVEEEELEQIVEDRGFDAWYELLGYKNSGNGQANFVEGVPTLGPYVLTSMETDRRVWERNPYYWKVDSEGNQLPYIDRIEADLVADREVLNGRIMAGDIDFAGWDTDIRNYPMFRQYEDQGNYRTIQWTSGIATDVHYMFNHTHEDENMREIFQDKQFKRAMSLAIDREEINEMIYFGQAEPYQMTVLPSSQYYKPEYSEVYTEYDPERAKEKLDEIGLVDQNGDGWRQLPNGDDFFFTIEAVLAETPKEPNVELVTEHWREIGINVDWEPISGELSGERAPANLMDANIWHGGSASDILFPIDSKFFVPDSTGWEHTIFPLWDQWYASGGDEGEEPPAHVKELRGWWEEMLVEPDRERRIELGQKILDMRAEHLWSIGTVGQAPWIVIAEANLRNIPEDALWAWDTLWSTTVDPEQFYFEGGSRGSN